MAKKSKESKKKQVEITLKDEGRYFKAMHNNSPVVGVIENVGKSYEDYLSIDFNYIDNFNDNGDAPQNIDTEYDGDIASVFENFQFIDKKEYNRLNNLDLPMQFEISSDTWELSFADGKLNFGCGSIAVTEKELDSFIKWLEIRRKAEQILKKIDASMDEDLLNNICNEGGYDNAQDISDQFNIEEVKKLKMWFKFKV